jgi:hypothetical protein
MSDDREKMERIGMIAAGREDLPARGLRFRQSTRLKILERALIRPLEIVQERRHAHEIGAIGGRKQGTLSLDGG